jgi:hypothetical protein
MQRAASMKSCLPASTTRHSSHQPPCRALYQGNLTSLWLEVGADDEFEFRRGAESPTMPREEGKKD